MRENGSSFSLNFISLPNPAVDDKNWVCWHHLQQFIFGKWCCVGCFDPFKFSMNSIFAEHFLFSLSTDRLSFYYFCLVTLQILSYIQVYSVVLALCSLGYAVCIFHSTDAKYLTFRVQKIVWLKGGILHKSDWKENWLHKNCHVIWIYKATPVKLKLCSREHYVLLLCIMSMTYTDTGASVGEICSLNVLDYIELLSTMCCGSGLFREWCSWDTKGYWHLHIK